MEEKLKWGETVEQRKSDEQSCSNPCSQSGGTSGLWEKRFIKKEKIYEKYIKCIDLNMHGYLIRYHLRY